MMSEKRPCDSSTIERRLCRRNRFLGGGFGRGAKPPSGSILWDNCARLYGLA